MALSFSWGQAESKPIILISEVGRMAEKEGREGRLGRARIWELEVPFPKLLWSVTLGKG